MSFYTLTGLPVHALVVHFAVVLLPLAALGVIASIYMPKFRQRYFLASMIGLVIGSGAAYVAKESGEALAERIGLPVRHSDMGTYLVAATALFVVSTLGWNYLRNKSRSNNPGVIGNAVALLGVVVIALTLITGHTGAQAVWEKRIQAIDAPSKPAVETKKTGTTISLAEVQKNNTSAKCWVIIRGNVYDLTQWIDRHPGGAGVITSMCGKDGTSGFTSQHGGQQGPEADLSSFKIGTLG